MNRTYQHHPDDVTDFGFDFGARRLAAGETITGATATADPPVTVLAVRVLPGGTQAVVWATGGRVGAAAQIRCVAETTTAPSPQTAPPIHRTITDTIDLEVV